MRYFNNHNQDIIADNTPVCMCVCSVMYNAKCPKKREKGFEKVFMQNSPASERTRKTESQVQEMRTAGFGVAIGFQCELRKSTQSAVYRRCAG